MPESIANRPLPDEPIGGENKDVLATAKERYDKAIKADQENRKWALEDLNFASGEQWDQTARDERLEDGRPMFTINRMPQFVRQVTGDIRQSRPAIKVRPADDVSDQAIADVFSGLIRHIEAASDAPTAYQTAAESSAGCGIGHFRVLTEYSDDDTFEQNIRISEIIDPFAVTWDPSSRKKTREDARYCFVEESLDIETFKARYADASTTGWDLATDQSVVGSWVTRDEVRIAEYWTKEKTKATLALLEDGRTLDVTGLPQFDGRYFNADGSPLPVQRVREVMIDRIEWRLITGMEVLEGPHAWPGKYIPIIPVLGEEIHVGPKTIRAGVIRYAKDAQRLYNHWRTAQTEQIALQPKAPFLVTAVNIQGYESIWKDANRRNLPYLPWVPDLDNAGAPPQRNVPQMGSPGMAEEVMLAAEDMKATTGIFDAGLGAKSNETSGRAIFARQQESDISTSGYMEGLARAIRQAGRILIDLIPRIYDTPRVVRILNEDETTDFVPLNQAFQDRKTGKALKHDVSVGKYDVAVTTGPSFTTKRMEAAGTMMEFIRVAPQIAPLIIDLVARNQDWPGADEIAKRLRKTLPPGLVEPEEGEEPPPPPPPDPAAQMTAMKTAADVEKTQAETEKIEAEIEQVEAETSKTEVEIVAIARGDQAN